MQHCGEIRVTRLEPETAVAWEGDRARGTAGLEPSGWGTTHARREAAEHPPPDPAPPLPDPIPAPDPAPPAPDPDALAGAAAASAARHRPLTG